MYSLIQADLTSHQVTLEALLDASPYTLLYFYPKNDTSGCTLEAQAFTVLLPAFKKLGIHVIGVSKDTAESHCKFIKKYKLKPDYLSDPTVKLHKKFGARGMKTNYGKTSEGTIRSTILLDKKGKIKKSWMNVKAAGHAESVLARCTSHIKEKKVKK